MDSPLVSIVIPCHNAGWWVADAIHSALAQTHTPAEVVVVDDGSTDLSPDIIKSFQGRIVFECVHHRGAPAARNIGWQLAKGEFIHFLDADDILFPSCLSRKIRLALNKGADVVYSGGFFYDVQANAGIYEPQSHPGESGADTVAHIIANTLVTSQLLCRRTSLDAVGGFDERFLKGQEHDLLFRLACRGIKFAYLPEALSLNRIHHNPSSITSITSKNPGHFEVLLSQFEERLRGTNFWVPQVRSALARRFHNLGVQYLIVGDKENSIKALKHAKTLHQIYTKDLPLSRRFMIPFLGSYLAEKFLTKLRQSFPRPSEQMA
jgi:glycosyltransferase involved in cell wall biosynthesis